MNFLIFFVLIFIIIYLFYILVLNKYRLKKKKYENMGELNYLVYKFNLDIQKINRKKLLNIIGFVNAFIISFTGAVVSLIPLNYIFQMIIGFIILLILIYICYELLGRKLVKKGLKKENVRRKKN